MSILDQLEQNLEGAKTTHKTQSAGQTGRRFVAGLLIQGRLIPYMRGDECRFLETFYHHYFTDASGKWQFLACPKNNGWEEDCGFCEPMKDHYERFGADGTYNNYKRKRKYRTNFLPTKVSKLQGYSPDDAIVKAWEDAIGTLIRVDLPWSLKEKVDGGLDDPELGTKIYNPLNGFDLKIKVTEKKTDKGDFQNYDTSEFARSISRVPGFDTDEELIAMLNGADDLIALIKKEAEQDAAKIHPAAVKEGLVVGDSDAEKPAAEKPAAAASKPAAEKPKPAAENKTEAPAEEAPAEEAKKEEPAAAAGSLGSIFDKYRKD